MTDGPNEREILVDFLTWLEGHKSTHGNTVDAYLNHIHGEETKPRKGCGHKECGRDKPSPPPFMSWGDMTA